MKNSFLPVALGLLTVVAVPLKTHANEANPDSAAHANAEVPIYGEAEATVAIAPPPEPEMTAMPVAQPTYTEPSGALNFEPTQFRSKPAAVQTATPAVESSQSSSSSSEAATHAAARSSANDFFVGGSESLVARTVGAAEGTRTTDGGKTQNYYGHVDPGNGVWNRGTFSYQFGNSENLSPDEADRRQLAKIKRIYESVMLPKAEKHGVTPLTVAEEINGIDLINQAPLAVTEDGGYIERLAEAKSKGLSGDDAILKARIWAFWDAGKGGWDAPGLRAYDDVSKEESIRRDQDRRMAMITKALAAYQQQNGNIASDPTPSQPTALTTSARTAPDGNLISKAAIANAIIFGEKPATHD